MMKLTTFFSTERMTCKVCFNDGWILQDIKLVGCKIERCYNLVIFSTVV